jgi:hypothetical protein
MDACPGGNEPSSSPGIEKGATRFPFAAFDRRLYRICGGTVGDDDKTVAQAVMHAHFHIIPRREGDAEDPRGGVRGVIPTRQSY